jgi:hypothetical protein
MLSFCSSQFALEVSVRNYLQNHQCGRWHQLFRLPGSSSVEVGGRSLDRGCRVSPLSLPYNSRIAPKLCLVIEMMDGLQNGRLDSPRCRCMMTQRHDES